jgi:hypothetical protein
MLEKSGFIDKDIEDVFRALEFSENDKIKHREIIYNLKIIRMS